jgi:hypothetical protein
MGRPSPLLDQVRWCAMHCDINPRTLSLYSLEALAATLILHAQVADLARVVPKGRMTP